MRFLLGLILSLGFLLFGLVTLGAGLEIMGAKGVTDDAIAALLVGGLLSIVGVIIFVISNKARKRRKAGKKADYSEASATILGMSMVSDSFDDDFSD